MKISTTIHEAAGYIASTFQGSITLGDLGAHVQSTWSDPRWKPEYNGILDFSAATLEMSERDVEQLTEAMTQDPRCSFGKWAFVVTTAADFAKLRRIDPVADLKSTIRIFFDRRSAEDWLLSRNGAGPNS